MSGLPATSASANVWNQLQNSPGAGLGGGNPTGLPVINNPNLPQTAMPNIGNVPPAIPFPNARPPIGAANGINSTTYGVPPNFPAYNTYPAHLVPSEAQLAQQRQNEANQRRLAQLETENAQRRTATTTLQQVGSHLLQDQMYVQEQVLQYQFMLEQCLETLDHQNMVLNGQAEELALLRAKLRTFENFMDTIKHNQDNKQQGISPDQKFVDGSLLCSRSFARPPGSPFSPGGVTRMTSSKFQPFNPRYRSPTGRSTRPNEPQNPNPPRPAARPMTNNRN